MHTKKNNKKALYLFILILLPLITKLFIAYSFFGPYDLVIYGEWGRLFYEDKNPYLTGQETIPAGAGPFLNLIYYSAYNLSIKTGVPFYFLEKIPIILFDTLISVILFMILGKRYGLNTSLFWSLFFALNPLVVFASSVYGQYDAMAVFFLLLSYLSFQSENPSVKNILPGIFIGFAITSKMVAVFFAPLLFFRYKTLKGKALFTSIVMLSCLIPFLMSPYPFDALYSWVYSPSTVPANWGFVKPFLFFARFIDLSGLFAALKWGRVLLPLLIVSISFLIRRIPLRRAYLAIFFSIFSFTFFFHPHYLYWVMPFLFLEPSVFSLIYWIPASLHIGFLDVFEYLFGYQSEVLSFGFGNIAWLFCLYGFLKYTSLWSRIKKKLSS